MICLRRQKSEVLKECHQLTNEVEAFRDELLNTLGPRFGETAPDDYNSALLRALIVGPDRHLSNAVADASRLFGRLRQKFDIILETALIPHSLEEYKREHRIFGLLVGSTPQSRFNILLDEIAQFREQIYRFTVLVQAADDAIEPKKDSVDVAVIIALQEEFREFVQLMGQSQSVRKGSRTYYKYSVNDAKITCVATMIGSMGTTQAASATADLLLNYAPKVIAVIGIAGAVSDDLKVGDVIVAKYVDAYWDNTKASDDTGSTKYTMGGGGYTPSPDISDLVANLEFTDSRWYQERWQQLTNSARIHTGTIGSGNVLSASTSFNRGLKEHRNREIKAVEMESSGILGVLERSGIRSIVIRGISDKADESKAKLEQDTNGENRSRAMRNATYLFRHLIEKREFLGDVH